VRLFKKGEKDIIDTPLDASDGSGYVGDWLLDIANMPVSERLHTDQILKGVRATLVAQNAADTNARDVNL
jgi:hypothetical protein